MTLGTRSRAALHAAAWSFVAARGIAAQTTASVDVGASTVRYDGFLASGAASVTPAAMWTRPGATLVARGSYLRFESGHRSLQGLIAASLFTPPALLPDSWRGEVTISGGGSSYADFASFWHATGEARLHFVGPGHGAWAGATAGRTSYGSAPRPVAVAGIGGWARRGWLMLTASASRSFIGDTAYTDVESTAEVGAGAWGLHGSVGARISSRGGGHGVYGAGEATRALSQHIAVFLSGGRYPTDPVSGSVAGRYLTVGVRIRNPTPRPPPTWDPVPQGRPPAAADGEATLAPQIEIQPVGDRCVRLLVRAPGATSVELAADFTDWHPIVLERVAEEGAWQLLLPVASGFHRLNVRIDGGKWIAPAGTTRSADEFGSEVGIVAVP
ncbi:MAG TPA: glycogen-binding domain-containing protein [Gemmatimonadales bacterium]|nr:glycogen-binding domain-containing protein [Gemmatimonadales bacterium]